jgi:hypothetical protein
MSRAVTRHAALLHQALRCNAMQSNVRVSSIAKCMMLVTAAACSIAPAQAASKANNQ